MCTTSAADWTERVNRRKEPLSEFNCITERDLTEMKTKIKNITCPQKWNPSFQYDFGNVVILRFRSTTSAAVSAEQVNTKKDSCDAAN